MQSEVVFPSAFLDIEAIGGAVKLNDSDVVNSK